MAWYELLFESLRILGYPLIILLSILIARGFIKYYFDERLEDFKSGKEIALEEYKSDKELTVEKFKSDLNIIAVERNIVFSRLHEKRADVLGELYKRLYILLKECKQFLAILETPDMPSKKDRYKAVAKTYNDVKPFFEENRIYLSEETATKIDSLFKVISEPVLNYGIHLYRPQDEIKEQANYFSGFVDADDDKGDKIEYKDAVVCVMQAHSLFLKEIAFLNY